MCSAGAVRRSRSTARRAGRAGSGHADLAVQHDLGGAHPGEQRDLRVPVLDRQQRRGRPATIRRRRRTTSCSGSGRLTPPRSRSRSSRSSPTSLSSMKRPRRPSRRRSPSARVVVAARTARTRARSTSTRMPSPVSSRSIVHSRAGRTWSGSRLAAPSDRTGGCSGTRWSGAYSVCPRRCASSSIGPPRLDEGGHVGDRVVHPEAVGRRRSMCSAWSRSIEPSGSMVTNGMSVRSSSGSVGSGRGLLGGGQHVGRELAAAPPSSRSIAAMPAVKSAPSWSCRFMLRRGTVAAFLSRVGT